MARAVIVHGTMGSPSGNWFPWLSNELANRRFETIVPKFPTPEGQTLANWLTHFSNSVGTLGPDDVLIGHSVGAVFALRVLELASRPIRLALLVAGFTSSLGLPEYDALNATFVRAPFDWSRIRAHAKEIVCMSGDNEPYVPFFQGKEIADNLGLPHQIIHGGGHLNAEFGYTSFPELLDHIDPLVAL